MAFAANKEFDKIIEVKRPGNRYKKNMDIVNKNNANHTRFSWEGKKGTQQHICKIPV